MEMGMVCRASFIILEQLGYLHQNIDNHPPLPPNTPRCVHIPFLTPLPLPSLAHECEAVQDV